LARAFVLASLPDDVVLARFYAAHWSIIPNLALDLIAPPLIQILSAHIAGRLLIAAAVLLPVLGAVAYNTALGGRWWAFGAGLVAYNLCLLQGFLNFEIALGLALLLAAGWLRWREARPALAILSAMFGAPVLFACHLMGLLFFGLLIGGAELYRIWRDWTVPGAIRRGAALTLVFVAPGLLYAASALRQLGGDAEFLPGGEKLLQLVTTFVNYDRTLDLTTAGVAIAWPSMCLLLRRGRVPGLAVAPMLLLLTAFLAMPFAWKGTYALDTRFAVMLGFMLFAGFVPSRWAPWFSRFAVLVFVPLFAARMGLLMIAWVAHRADLTDVRAALVPVRPGQSVYVAETGLDEAPEYWRRDSRWRRLSNGARMDEHLGALALIEHHAYWPFQFDVPSQQPIETLEPYKARALRIGRLPSHAEAAVADVCGFDFVLLIAADAAPDLPTERFRLLIRSGYAALYQIERCRVA
jgi:hypothetical protein